MKKSIRLGDKPPLAGYSESEVLSRSDAISLKVRRPEDLAEVAHYTVSPPANTIPFIIAPAEVRDAWSNKRRLQCNVCNRQHKFVSGGYYAYYRDGYIYVVGPVCGREDQRRDISFGLKAYEQRVRREIADDKVKSFIDNLESYRDRTSQALMFGQIARKVSQIVKDGMSDEQRRIFREALESDSHTLPVWQDYRGRRAAQTIRCAHVFLPNPGKKDEIRMITTALDNNFDFRFSDVQSTPNFNADTVATLSGLVQGLDDTLQVIEDRKKMVRSDLYADLTKINAWSNQWLKLNKTDVGFDLSNRSSNWIFDLKTFRRTEPNMTALKRR
ncbi:hypothetical protein ACFFUB_14945 [Algimonas porphyrae]|uniref:Uncharacterized protein n=1 Tax=Algimonas porphyrae TaxID=1128113 RepID=A0ABQ5UZ62_9PROT|nr:hypothetical protein [Algimonas porphyrae]GLQ19724.1 hypothetical protein GCM10007854_06790 [Algimonas porphyrae]